MDADRCPNLAVQPPEPEPKPKRSVTVRMPEELHRRVKHWAWFEHTSMNLWIIEVLERAIGDANIDQERALVAPGDD